MLSVASLTVIRHYDTLATGIIYFHRFYMFHSFKQFPRYVSSLDAYPSVFLHSQTKCVELKVYGCDLCFGRWRVLAVFSWPGKWRKPQRNVKTSSRQPAAYWMMCSSLSSETTRRCRYFYSPSDVSRDIFTVYAGHCMFKESLSAEKVIITACNPL